jgi:hypothetical protein
MLEKLEEPKERLSAMITKNPRPDKIEVFESSGNIYADLGFENSDELLTQSQARILQESRKELSTFRKNLPRLLKDEGKYVVVRKKSIEGPFDTYRDALEVGYRIWGLKGFLTFRIERIESVHFQ